MRTRAAASPSMGFHYSALCERADVHCVDRSIRRGRGFREFVERVVWSVLVAAAKQRREHLLQSPDEDVRLAAAFAELLDLRVLGRHLAAEKVVLAFELLHIAVVAVRVRSRLFGGGRCLR